MTTVSQLAEVIRRRLYAGQSRSRYNFLASDITDTATALSFADEVAGIEVGANLSIGSELLYVRSVNKAGQAATVVRGHAGSTASSHSADDMIEVAPRFWLGDVIEEMGQEVRSWPANLFRAVTLDVTTASDIRTYDLEGEGGNVLHLLDCLTNENESATWRTADGAWSSVPAIFVQDPDRTTFPSGQGLQLRTLPLRAATLRVTYAVTYEQTELVATDDLTEDLGIPAAWFDIIRYGVMWRMMSTREVGRTDPQSAGESRRDEALPAGYISQTANSLMKLRDRRIADEALRLRARWPYKAP